MEPEPRRQDDDDDDDEEDSRPAGTPPATGTSTSSSNASSCLTHTTEPNANPSLCIIPTTGDVNSAPLPRLENPVFVSQQDNLEAVAPDSAAPHVPSSPVQYQQLLGGVQSQLGSRQQFQHIKNTSGAALGQQPRLPSMPLLEMLAKMQQKAISIHTTTQSAQESHQSNAKPVQTSVASGSMAHVVHPARGQLAVASVSSRHHQLPHAQKGPLPQPFQGQLRTSLAKIGSVTRSTFPQTILSEEVATSASDHSQVKCPAETNGLCTIAQINYQQSQTSHALLTSMKAVPSWLPSLTQVQGAVEPAGTANMGECSSRNRGIDNPSLIIVNSRKVRLTPEVESASLYSLCRRWVRNDAHRKDQLGQWDCVVSLPKPLSAAEIPKYETETMENMLDDQLHVQGSEATSEELLQHHVKCFKHVRKRAREERMQRIARFKPRLALLLPPM